MARTPCTDKSMVSMLFCEVCMGMRNYSVAGTMNHRTRNIVDKQIVSSMQAVMHGTPAERHQ